jgi:hypothetical protein
MAGLKKIVVAAAVAAMSLGAGGAMADHIVTGSGDPEYTHFYQGADAATFAGLGYSIGTGAGDLKVHTNGTWTDPAGLVFGTLINPASVSGYGHTFNTLVYTDYTTSGTDNVTNGNARDYKWIQNNGTNTGGPSTATSDTPWTGNIFDLGGQANQAVVFPIIDHGPLPGEAGEYTVYLTNNPLSTNYADWTLATLDSIYMEGWQDDSVAIADGFTTVWKLPGNATFRYVSVEAVGSHAIPGYIGIEDEIDAVAGLTAEGLGVAAPVPSTALAGGLILVGLGTMQYFRRRGAEARA